MQSGRLGLAVLALCTAVAAHADETALDVDYSLRLAYFSHDRLPTPGPAQSISSLWLRSNMTLSTDVKLYTEGWLLAVADGQGDTGSRADLREGWLSWSQNDLDFKVGRRIVVWGRADKINPTDQITPIDHTLLFSSDDDHRSGSFMTAVGVPVTRTSKLELLWLPEFRPHRLRLAAAPGTTLQDGPQEGWVPTQAAIRYDNSGSSIDWSVSYFNGLDRMPEITALSPTLFQQQHHRIQTLGADVATTVGALGLRGEVAYTAVAHGDQADRKHSFLHIVAGGDTDVTESINVNIQALFKHVMGDLSPARFANPLDQVVALQNNIISEQTSRDRYGFSARIGWHGFNDTATCELSALVYPQLNESLLRGKASYAFTDTIQGFAGFDLFNGDSESSFGALRKTSLGYVGVRVGY
ncbi:MAG: hypothetical protein HQL60_07295 [Magnetococcales bacterium]|nr:hypothetical protein [Magnetococcales bacterium]